MLHQHRIGRVISLVISLAKSLQRIMRVGVLSFAASIALGIALGIAFVARAESPTQPMWILTQARFQCEVTVLSVEHKPIAGTSGTAVWHRVRIDRLLVGSGIDVGFETAVVSQIYDNAAGTTGGSGMRGSFRGSHGLPITGDRARLYADGTRSIMKPVFPNGWQEMTRRVALVDGEVSAANPSAPSSARSSAPPSLTSLASLLPRAEITLSRIAAESPLHLYVDAYVCALAGPSAVDSMAQELAQQSSHGIPMAIYFIDANAMSPTRASDATPSRTAFEREVVGATMCVSPTSTTTTMRVLPPTSECATHAILKGINIPAEGVVIATPTMHAETLADDCTVLLWGEVIESSPSKTPTKWPLLWVRERARVAQRRLNADGSWRTATPIPAQRLCVNALASARLLSDERLRALAVNTLDWTLELTRVGETSTAEKFREAATVTPTPR